MIFFQYCLNDKNIYILLLHCCTHAVAYVSRGLTRSLDQLKFRYGRPSSRGRSVASSADCTGPWPYSTGWGGVYLHLTVSHPALLGLGFVAYLLGVRHAFDADHIAAIDDTVSYLLLQKDKKPLDAGFFFALGHSTVVTGLAIGIAPAANAIKRDLPQLQNLGGLISTGVSGLFLWVIGILNLVVLLDLLKVGQRARTGTHSPTQLEALLRKRGLLNRLWGGCLQRFMTHGWQMYPVGLLSAWDSIRRPKWAC